MALLARLPWWSALPLSAGFGLMGIFAPDAFPAWVRISLFWAGAALAVVGVSAAAVHFRPKGWWSRNVAWRFKLRQPAHSPSIDLADVQREYEATHALAAKDMSPVGRPWIDLPKEESDAAKNMLRELHALLTETETGIHAQLRWTGNAPQKLPEHIGKAPGHLRELIDNRERLEKFRADNTYLLQRVKLEEPLRELGAANHNVVAPLDGLVRDLNGMDVIPASVWPLLQKVIEPICRQNGKFGNAISNFRNAVEQTRESIRS